MTATVLATGPAGGWSITVSDFTILVPSDLESSHRRLLKAMVTKAGFAWPMDGLAMTWGQVQARGHKFVLSVGKGAVDLWHEYGLILVGHHHGCIFQHRDARGEMYIIMVVEHPGTLMQLSMGGHEAKDAMGRDLAVWKKVVERGGLEWAGYVMMTCAPCRKRKESIVRAAEHHEERLDMVGLCDDHFRKRASIRKKPVKRVEKSSREGQMPGQLEGFVKMGDAMKVMVEK